MNYLITGGEFNNKGAEAMTLTAMKNIYANDEKAHIYMFKGIVEPPFELNVPLSYVHVPHWMFLKLLGKSLKGYGWVCIKDVIKAFLPGYSNRPDSIKRTLTILKSIDYCIDVSGYAFGSKWSDEHNRNWLDWLSIAVKFSKSTYMMPQSFGPMEFEGDDIPNRARQVFGKCKRIYAREKSGMECLHKLGVECIRTPDSVLLEKDFVAPLLIKNYKQYEETVELGRDRNVAIIPNGRLIDVGGVDRDGLMRFYSEVIDRLCVQYDIYLVAHAGEDLAICHEIKEKYAHNDAVRLIDHVMFSFNYEMFVRKMDFIIASRYHSIIHAYKEHTPAIILGWSDKYSGVAEDVCQQDYLADIRENDRALSIVERMGKNYESERVVIRERIKIIQEQSCYDFLKE
ncbi:MAG: polysaccharide pyruvyl transferase family protein [Lachnospiraceae bacterium]|nr:polysaccharide pyruvyl transferase family protein [Lachnospiraceae bacterium]MBQ8947859.1 polysaccharide pyruvyl transferase family protein [Lachnospiraceae bacterium]